MYEMIKIAKKFVMYNTYTVRLIVNRKLKYDEVTFITLANKRDSISFKLTLTYYVQTMFCLVCLASLSVSEKKGHITMYVNSVQMYHVTLYANNLSV